jgi:hypothetical protein
MNWNELRKAASYKGMRVYKKDNGVIDVFTNTKHWETTESELIKYLG